MPESQQLVKGSKAGRCAVIAMPERSRANAGGKVHAQRLSKANGRLRALEWLKDQVVSCPRSWMTEIPNGTLQDLAERFELAISQCQRIIALSAAALRIADQPCMTQSSAADLVEWENDGDEFAISYLDPELEELLCSVSKLVAARISCLQTERVTAQIHHHLSRLFFRRHSL
jgi:hypothetical protein